MGDLHVLRAGLDPLDRPPELARGPARDQLLAVDLELGAEAAADVGGDHANVVLGQAEQQRHEQPHEVRHLGRGPERQRTRAVVGQHAPRLDRRAGDPVVDDLALDDHVGVGEPRLDVASGQRPLVHLVGAECLVDEWPSRERGLGIDDRRQRFVLDDHVLDRVVDRVAVVADHHRDRIPDVVDDPARQRPVLGVVDVDARRHPRHRQRRREIRRVGAGVDGVDPRSRCGGGRVDRDDLGVCLGRADERRPQHPGQRDVVDIASATDDQRRVLLTP